MMPYGQRTVRLAGPDDLPGALAALASLLAEGTEPEAVLWQDGRPTQAGLFEAQEPAPPAWHPGSAGPDAAALTTAPDPTLRSSSGISPSPSPNGRSPETAPLRALPPEALPLLRSVLLHDSPERLPLAHRWLRRLQAQPAAWHDQLHPERLQLERMAREVRREVHKMHAFVRFRPVPGEDGLTRHVAWFEPAHPIVRAAAPFFQQRFAAMHWAILTPRGSVQWDRRTLQFGPPAQREDAPGPDAGEALWLTYYRSIFNPARLKPAMMRREMPVRFWRNLPEAAAIAPLMREAPQREQRMQAEAADTTRRLPTPPRSGSRAIDNPDGWEAPALPNAPTAQAARQRLRALAEQAAHCQRCAPCARATTTVFGRGAVHAAVMLVGEQPGDQEDLAGRPFVGPAGQLLQAAIATLGWPLNRLYVTNAVKHFHHRLQGQRRIHKTPQQQAVAACLDWLEAEVDAVNPQVIVALGRTAAQALLGPAAPGPSSGARVQRGDGRWVHVLRHPAALLRAGVAAPVSASQAASAHPRQRADAAHPAHPTHAAWVARLGQVWADVLPPPASTPP